MKQNWSSSKDSPHRLVPLNENLKDDLALWLDDFNFLDGVSEPSYSVGSSLLGRLKERLRCVSVRKVSSRELDLKPASSHQHLGDTGTLVGTLSFQTQLPRIFGDHHEQRQHRSEVHQQTRRDVVLHAN